MSDLNRFATMVILHLRNIAIPISLLNHIAKWIIGLCFNSSIGKNGLNQSSTLIIDEVGSLPIWSSLKDALTYFVITKACDQLPIMNFCQAVLQVIDHSFGIASFGDGDQIKICIIFKASLLS
ncbi:MAG: hypothetical protein SP1CHLAM42_05960 [Chlamydiales bacterium]|nr:hypothetical protein [Chlamydiales bacterium]